MRATREVVSQIAGRTQRALRDRDLSRGFNQLAVDLAALDADRRLMLAGISHDLSTPLTRLRLALELMHMKGDSNDAANMIRDVEDINAILLQFADYARSGREE